MFGIRKFSIGVAPSTRGLGAGAAFCLVPALAAANDRAFTYSYESTTLAPGSLELEQWVTWKTDKADDPDFDRLDFRHELEYGLTDRFQLAAYFDWRYQDGASVDEDEVDFHDVALEGIYSLTNPVTDLLGSALYGEVKVGEQLLELEAKLILDKKVDDFTLAWNGILEAEWEESGLREKKGVLAQTFGVQYSLNRRLAVGAELLHEFEIEDWEKFEGGVLSAGPNLSLRTSRLWTTVTALAQLTDRDNEPDYQVRCLVGFHF